MLERATSAFASNEISAVQQISVGLAGRPCRPTCFWDEQSWHAINARQLQLAVTPARRRLPIDLTAAACLDTWRGGLCDGRLTDAIAEAEAVTEATGARIAPYSAMLLAAFRGRETRLDFDSSHTIANAAASGQGNRGPVRKWTAAILNNGLGRYEQCARRSPAGERRDTRVVSLRLGLPELIEAAVRSEDAARRRGSRSA